MAPAVRADETRDRLLRLPLAERVHQLIDEAGRFLCPHRIQLPSGAEQPCGVAHPFLPARPDPPEAAPGGFTCSNCGEATVINPPPADGPADAAPEPTPPSSGPA